ncbi:DUF2809 domain-containing protein [uncultured Chryseobacterium sp.]|uniref:ribosomal maturation YjgA family protein n=1 Tax=uncultured Chryseobacterium sp. TaxID=259322 RepID=UPI002613A7CA|nr:DUF2809 domain-containing protein [uncultured Chryseobacterium sp.]
MKIQFNPNYFIVFIIIFVTEVLIATVFKNIAFVRAFLGDVLVVMLIYTFVLSFFNIQNKTKLILGIFAFSLLIEIVQYFKTADLLGFKPGSWQHIVLGNSFSWVYVLCYAIGCVIIWFTIFKLKKEPV